MHGFALASLLLATAGAGGAETPSTDMAAVEARIDTLEPGYGMILSDIGCDNPTIPAHNIMCASAKSADPVLWRMGRLDDLAWIYAVENATGRQVDPTNPPRDADFIARRDARTDAACLAEALTGHSNDSLGGTSPLPAVMIAADLEERRAAASLHLADRAKPGSSR